MFIILVAIPGFDPALLTVQKYQDEEDMKTNIKVYLDKTSK